MDEKIRLMDRVLEALHREGLLEHFIVVGSWCVYFYKHHFQNVLHFPPWRTTDIEFDTSLLRKASKKVDITRVLKEFDFVMRFHGDEGYTSYVHPEIIIEFLVPQKGEGRTNPYKVPGFGINPQPIRFLSVLEEDFLVIDYRGLPVKVPHPAHFSLHKLLVSVERKNRDKVKKDREQAMAVWEMLKNLGEEDRLQKVFSALSRKQRNLIVQALKEMNESGKAEMLAI
jgi:hypothetical protein